MTSLAVEVSVRPRATNDELQHVYCCDPDISMCGLDIRDLSYADAEPTCMVCIDLEESICLLCGE